MEYPIRINKYLSQKNYCSRRKADEFIKEGKVLVNGEKAELGQKITESDTVEVFGELKNMSEMRQYYIFNKPKGVVTLNPQRGETGVENIFKPASYDQPKHLRVSPVGRLDKDSRGLLFLTNDGRVVDPILNPEANHEKEYVVAVNKPLKKGFKNKMENGVLIEGYRTKRAEVKIVGDKNFHITLTEGKKHQIRRMVTALGYEVKDLKRIRIMNLGLGNLPEGEGRQLKDEETQKLLQSIGVN